MPTGPGRAEGLVGQTAREYRIAHPKMPTLALARLMYHENVAIFTNIDSARCALRRIEGKAGQFKKDGLRDKTLIMDKERPRNPYNLPDSGEAKFEPYVLKGYKRIGVLSDIHIPYHSIAAVTAAFDFLKKEKPDLILLDGDAVDCHTLSRFLKDPRKKHFDEELGDLDAFFKILQKTFGCKIIFKLGNHEERYSNYLCTHPELSRVKAFQFENVIQAEENGIEVIGQKRIIKAGSLNIIHGHEFAGGFFNPVNVARGLFLRGKTSALQGHSHQTSEHTENDMNGKITTTWSIGCLCELHPQFMPINKWNHGFGIIDMDGDNFEVRNKRIFNGKVL